MQHFMLLTSKIKLGFNLLAEMGSEAQIRFLKAKVRVMQEELDRLAHEASKKVKKLNIQ